MSTVSNFSKHLKCVDDEESEADPKKMKLNGSGLIVEKVIDAAKVDCIDKIETEFLSIVIKLSDDDGSLDESVVGVPAIEVAVKNEPSPKEFDP